MKTDKLFGVTPEVVKALKKMSHEDYLEIGVVLMERVQVKNVDDYQSQDFQYRAKAITNYREWSKEN